MMVVKELVVKEVLLIEKTLFQLRSDLIHCTSKPANQIGFWCKCSGTLEG